MEHQYILTTIDDLDKVHYYGPFKNSEEAIDWGLRNFDSNHTLSAHPIYSVVPKGYFIYKPEVHV